MWDPTKSDAENADAAAAAGRLGGPPDFFGMTQDPVYASTYDRANVEEKARRDSEWTWLKPAPVSLDSDLDTSSWK